MQKQEVKTENIQLSASLQVSRRYSYLGLQIFEFMYAQQFPSVCEATSIFQTKQYLRAPSTQFLCLLDSKISETQAQGLSIEILQQDLSRFRDFQNGETQLKATINCFESGAEILKTRGMIKKIVLFTH